MSASAHVSRKVIVKVADKHSGRTFMALVMKLHFSNRKERSEIRAVLTVVAVLVIGVLAKLDATMQLFHLSR